MKNYVQEGKKLQLTAPYTVSSGGGAKVGNIFGIATFDVASGALGEFLTEGVITHAKTSAQAWSVGDKVYWDDTNKRLDNASPAVGMLVGVATAAAANPSSTGTIKLTTPHPQGVDVADVTTTNAVDLATSEALANQLKTSLNALLDSLRNAGVIQ